MQYIYVLDYFNPSRVTIKVDDNIDVSEKIDDILRVNGLKESQCSWLISDKSLDDEEVAGVITKI